MSLWEIKKKKSMKNEEWIKQKLTPFKKWTFAQRSDLWGKSVESANFLGDILLGYFFSESFQLKFITSIIIL